MQREPLFAWGLRRPIESVAWGSGPGQLPYESSDMGGRQAKAASEQLVVPGDLLWLRDVHSGRVWVMSSGRQRTIAVDLGSGAPPHLGEARLVCFAMAMAGVGEVALLIGGWPNRGDAFSYAVAHFSAAGSAIRSVALTDLANLKDSPERLAVGHDGRYWVIFAAQTLLLEPDGRLRATLPGGGVYTPEGWYVASEPKPQVFSAAGAAAGGLDAPRTEAPLRLLAAGPAGCVVATCETAKLPEPLAKSVELRDVYRLDVETKRLELYDRITLPAPVHADRGSDRDGQSILSYFPPQGIAFDPEGAIRLIEHEPTSCRLHRMPRFEAQGGGWRKKFEHPDDLSSSERAIARSEYWMRLGKPAKAAPLDGLFKSMAWLGASDSGVDPIAGSDGDPILKKLESASIRRS